MTMIPKCWHLYTVNLEPTIKFKPGKQRPCLVIQPTLFSEAGLESVVILPLTTNISKEDAFPLRVNIPGGVAGLKQSSDLLIDQILAWDRAFFKKELGVLPDGLIYAVKLALIEFLDLS